MPDKVIVKHYSPTLAGIKTGSLFTVFNKERRIILSEIRHLNRMLSWKGIRVVPVKFSGRYTLIYIYRPSMLERDLSEPEARSILEEKGYTGINSDYCLAELIRNLEKYDDFPHEIGLFLGYPPEDVKGFMDSPNGGYKLSGCWKVYGNREQAEQKFRDFKKCTESYEKAVDMGVPLLNLTVAASTV